MKLFLPSLKVGDIVTAEVIDASGPNAFIVKFESDLIRVANETRTSIKVGDRISLIVATINPLSFRLSTAFKRKSGQFQTRA